MYNTNGITDCRKLLDIIQ